MSRFDQPSEPDFDKYEDREDDVLPAGFGELEAVIDPAEHATHTLIDAMDTLSKQLALAPSLERARQLRQMITRSWGTLTALVDSAADTEDRFVEKN